MFHPSEKNIKSSKTRGQASKIQMIAHDDPPNLYLRCLQIPLFSFLALYVLVHLTFPANNNPCSPTFCHQGTCYSRSDGSYHCACHKGYTGTNCDLGKLFSRWIDLMGER